MDSFPPPHRVFYEPLNDREMSLVWNTYKTAHEHEADFEEVDAATMNGMEDFARWFNQWITFTPSRVGIRIRILIVWHAHFLSLACQQMLRRSLEQRSFRCRIWFHAEEPTLQAAILSRCIVTTLPVYRRLPQILGSPLNVSLWKNPRVYETNLLASKE